MGIEEQIEINLTPFQKKVVNDLLEIQDSICAALETLDGSDFREDIWNHTGGGGGRTRVMNGSLIEKGGVNFSAVTGPVPAMMKDRMHPDAKTCFATGVSLVIHPFSPQVPIVHMNVRYFESDAGDQWIGGGIDLTPIYVNEEQRDFFHAEMKNVCDTHGMNHEEFKLWADKYFFIPHRKETRGVGGIFYDYQKPSEQKSMEELWAFNNAVGHTFNKAYLPIVEANMHLEFTEQEKQWQLLRRGRYVEFNLVCDKGTLFGLQTGGRTESILMSLPKFASWEYDFQVEPNSPEEHTLNILRSPIA
jgi:coproporphyrinogen III oxidase